MCGIAGLCGWRGDWRSNIEKMNERMAHRGPDAAGVWAEEDGSVVLGHRRLSIIDLSEAGTQPMLSESGRFVISYNGEIYNYQELAERLIAGKKVSGFRGSSDTEVLLAAVESYGVQEALTQCKGMFAFALWDRKERTLTLARDRVGEKPLYYGMVQGSFVFASDLNSIAVLDGFEGRMDVSALSFYFTHGYIPAPYSIYEGIQKLPAGTFLTVKEPFGQCEPVAYWSMKEAALYGQAHPFTGSRQEAADELERLLKRSIRGQMCADVPLGAFLSAGIDSSTVVALMQAQSSAQVRSFTIGMEDAQYNEADAAEKIAAHLGTKHTRLTITEQDAKAVIPQISGIFGEPFGDSSQIPTYLVSKLTREHVTVALSGDGGDELFAGYNIYGWADRIWGKMKTKPRLLRKAAGGLIGLLPLDEKEGLGLKGKLLKADGILDVYRMNYDRDPLVRRLAPDGVGIRPFYARVPEGLLDCPLHEVMLQDMLLYHPDDILVKVDRTAMAVSLETRVPMLDKDVVEFAWSLPLSFQRQGDVGKLVLRDVLYRYVPKEWMERPKKGFSIPIRRWLAEPELREWAESLLCPDALSRSGALDGKAARQIWEDYTERGIWRPQVWYLLMFQQWMEGRA